MLCAHMEKVPKISGTLGPGPPLRMGLGYLLETHSSPHMSPYQIWSLYKANSIGLRRGNEAWLTPRNMLLPHLLYCAKFGHFRSNHTSVIMEIRQTKFDPLRPAFQGHSRSLEETRIDRQPMTSY